MLDSSWDKAKKDIAKSIFDRSHSPPYTPLPDCMWIIDQHLLRVVDTITKHPNRLTAVISGVPGEVWEFLFNLRQTAEQELTNAINGAYDQIIADVNKMKIKVLDGESSNGS